MKKLGIILLVGFIALPVAAVITIFMAPFWGWFEARTGIESLGHSGPADWCYATTYGVVVLASLGVLILMRKKDPPGR